MRPQSLVKVPEWWRDKCRAWIVSEGLTWAAAGERIASAMERVQPYNHTTVWRYLTGQLHSIEITLGFARCMGHASPLFLAQDERELRWCTVGQSLSTVAPEMFDAILAQAEAVLASKKHG